MRDRVARIHITLKISGEELESLLKEVLDAGRSLCKNN